MERPMGLEPTPGPWQGPVLPLYYGRPNLENSNTPLSHRQGSTPFAEAIISLVGTVESRSPADQAEIDVPKTVFQPTWMTRAVLTTGDFRWRSANLDAFSRSV